MASVSPTAACAGTPVARLGRRAWPRVQERTREFAARAFISSLFVVLAIERRRRSSCAPGT